MSDNEIDKFSCFCEYKNSIRDNIDTVVYHAGCLDGFGSAFIVWYYYKIKYGIEKANSIKYLPFDHRCKKNISNKFNDKTVLICDFSFNLEKTRQLIQIVKSLLIIDHHKSALENLDTIDDKFKIFDMNMSGVGLTWKYFFGNKMPKFLKYIQDYDLWMFKYSETKKFISYISNTWFDFIEWEKYLSSDHLEKCIEIGKHYFKNQSNIVRNILRSSYFKIHEINQKYFIVAYVNSSMLKSELGNKMMKKYRFCDFACIWNYENNSYTKYSFRSTNKKYDVLTIASNFNGGGHRNASGCEFSGCITQLPFNSVNDTYLINVIARSKIKIFIFNTKPEKFVILECENINNDWFGDKYTDMIKRCFSECLFIVWKTLSDNVYYDENNKTVLRIPKYFVIFNEKSQTNPTSIMQYLCAANKNCIAEFETPKDITEIFQKFSPETVHVDSTMSPENDENDVDSLEILETYRTVG